MLPTFRIVTGKGGVGKTVTATSLAVKTLRFKTISECAARTPGLGGLQRASKFTLVVTDEERAIAAKLREESYQASRIKPSS